MNYHHHRRSIALLWRGAHRSLSAAAATSSPTPSTFPTKTVTKLNFESALEALRHLVKSADYVAIDLEMTGITSAPWREMFEFDRYDVRYLKIKDSAEKFAVVQFGVCPFRWDTEKLSFIAYPHNFYIFPRQELLDGSSSEFLCQTASVDFLAKYQFDFNACINEGVSYLSREQEKGMLRHLDESLNMQHSLKKFKEVPLVKMADLFFSERMKNRFTEWLDGLLGNKSSSESYGTTNTSSQQLETTFYRLRPALHLRGFTAHQLRLIQQVVRKHFEYLAYMSVDGENSDVQHLLVYTDSKADREVLMKEVNDEVCRGERVRIDAAVGFRRIIDLLSSEKKLIVGHNCFLDVAHMYSKFFGPLPLDVREFVHLANKYFPCIFDTKVLLNSSCVLKHQMKKASTSLSRAFAGLCPQIALGYRSSNLAIKSSVRVEVQVDDMRALTWDAGAKHEAGYDAFMTGCLFAQACSHLGVDFKINSLSEVLVNNEVLQKHANLLYLSWTYGDIIDLSTGNRITESHTSTTGSRRHIKIIFENIVIMWGFLPTLKSKEIRDCISKVFGPSSVAFVYHLDETAVFIQFSKREFVSEFLSLKESLAKNNDPISVLHPFSKLLEGGNTFAAEYEIYREICTSSISKVLFADQAEAVGIRWRAKLLQCSSVGGTLSQDNLSGNGEGSGVPNSKEKSDMSSDEAALDSSFPCDGIVDSCPAPELERVRTF